MKNDVLMYLDLIASIKTTQEVDDLSSEIDLLTTTLFKSAEMTLGKAIASISAPTGKKIIGIFSKNNLDITDKEIVSNFLQTIKDLIRKFKIIKLTLAFDPIPKTIENIHNFVSKNIGIGYILDIEVSPDVLSGAIVIFNGQYKDYTLRKSLDEAFVDKKEEILSSIQQVKS